MSEESSVQCAGVQGRRAVYARRAFKRRLVDDALRGVEWNFARGEDNTLHVKQPVLGHLAMVYADHPDFDARWIR